MPRILLAALTLLLLLTSSAEADAARVRFGVYPGGGVGTVGANAVDGSSAERREETIDALEGLGPAPRVTVRLYTQSPLTPGDIEHLDAQVTDYRRVGHPVQLVVRYRRTDGDLDAWRTDVRHIVREVGPNLASVQVTNEANVAHSPGSSDGAYPRALAALTGGIVAAHRQALRSNRRLRIGFGVAATDATARFWRALAARPRSWRAHAAFAGVASYPGTWPDERLEAGQARARIRSALAEHRVGLRRVGLSSVDVYVSENGWPTTRARSETRQTLLLRAMTDEVVRLAARYRVREYAWFDLRDAAPTDLLEHGYGLLRADFTPKPAYGAYASVIRRYGR